MLITPVTPRFPAHQFALDILRRKSVYGWPPPAAEWVQEMLQKRITEMHADGYPPEVISRILRTLYELTICEADQFACNVSRATFFAALIETEITQ